MGEAYGSGCLISGSRPWIGAFALDWAWDHEGPRPLRLSLWSEAFVRFPRSSSLRGIYYEIFQHAPKPTSTCSCPDITCKTKKRNRSCHQRSISHTIDCRLQVVIIYCIPCLALSVLLNIPMAKHV